MSKPLEGYKVIEFSTYVAGPTAGRLLADWGAEVIKVEAPKGDVWRYAVYQSTEKYAADENPIFDIYNMNKKDIALDTKTQAGRDVLLRLTEGADVFLTNNRPQALKGMGLDYDSLKERFPRLVYAQLTGYGQEGPDCNAPGFDSAAFWARSGMLCDPLTPEAYPVSAPNCFGDAAVGSSLFGGICAALLAREKTGRGDLVEISLYGTAVWFTGCMMMLAQDQFYTEYYPRPRNKSNPMVLSYKCKDGEWILITIIDYATYWRPFCQVMDLNDIVDDPRYKDYYNICLNAEVSIPTIEAAFAKLDYEEAARRLSSVNIVFSKLGHFKDVHKDPQALINDFVRNFTYNTGRSVIVPMPPVKSRNLGKIDLNACPKIGENTAEILSAAGYSTEEISALKAAKLVR